MTTRYDVGIIGAGVMGANLALNLVDKGYSVVLYDTDIEKAKRAAERDEKGKIGYVENLRDFAASLLEPRKILLFVPAGRAVDQVVDSLFPLLQASDTVCDCGNSFFLDTEARLQRAAKFGVRYLGIGVSGGEKGARFGPSIMAGGHRAGWEELKPVFEAIAAKADGPCAAYLGNGGAGHLVKMVHNGIEYADMEALAEAYHLLKAAGKSIEEIEKIFSDWHNGDLNSYLTDLSVHVFRKKDEETGKPLVELILDSAQQKGTGKWTTQVALDEGSPAPGLGEAVFQRFISALKQRRVELADTYSKCKPPVAQPQDDFENVLGKALLASRILSFVQGLELIAKVSQSRDLGVPIQEAVRVWKGGCIIRCTLLETIHEAVKDVGQVTEGSLLGHAKIRDMLCELVPSLRSIVVFASTSGVPVPVLYANLSYFDSMTTDRLPANFIQALRDGFGSHTYERIDKEGKFHTEWME